MQNILINVKPVSPLPPLADGPGCFSTWNGLMRCSPSTVCWSLGPSFLFCKRPLSAVVSEQCLFASRKFSVEYIFEDLSIQQTVNVA